MIFLIKYALENGHYIAYQDEVHFQICTTIARIWAEKGSEPFAECLDTKQSLGVSGFDILNNGQFIYDTPETFNCENFISSLRNFIKVLNPQKGQKIYLICDNASWHKKAKRLIKTNANGEFDDINEYIVFVYLPPYSPDLNPNEQFWRLVRKCVTHNKYFASFESLQNAIFDYFNNFEDDT